MLYSKAVVKFRVTGDAKIIGVGNDPSSHEQDKYNGNRAQRRLFNGKAQVIIQGGKSSESVLLTAATGSLIEAKAEWRITKPPSTNRNK